MMSSIIPKVRDSVLSFSESETCLIGGHMALLPGGWLTGSTETMLSQTGREDAGRVRHGFDPKNPRCVTESPSCNSGS